LQAAEHFVANQQRLHEQVSDDKDAKPANRQPETLFSAIRRSGAPDSEKTASRISQEGTEMFMASFTPGRTMMLAMYYLHAHPKVLGALRKELDEANPQATGQLSYKMLNSLPYLVRTQCSWPMTMTFSADSQHSVLS
jgi:cytochrome P450